MAYSTDSNLLHNFLFHLRTSLSGIDGASKLAKQIHETMPVSVLSWFEKWKPLVDTWLSNEEKAHSYFTDGEDHNWEQIVFEMAQNMKNVEIAYSDAKSLEVEELNTNTSKLVVELVLQGMRHLNKIIQPILSKNYRHLL